MGNLLYVRAMEKGCEVAYTDKNHEVITSIKNVRLKRWLNELGKFYNQPVKETTKLVAKKYGYHQKVPSIIKMNEILLFPTVALNDHECYLINYYCVNKYHKDNVGTRIKFHDHNEYVNIPLKYEVSVPFDRRIIKNQMQRCQKLHNDYRCMSLEEYLN